MQFTDLLLSWLQFFLGLLAINKSTDIDLWISEPKNNIFLSQSSVGLKFTPTSTANISTVNYTINVNEGVKYQQMDGFGASLTDASSWLLFYHLSVSKRLEILRQIFGRDGIRISLLRQPIGATDFAWNQWSFDDTTNNIDDFNMSSFSLWREDAYIRPILDQALAIDRGRVKLFATPWSPPAWMKSQKNMIATVGGSLRPDCYDAYGNYFIKYLQENERRGTPIYAITMQNEPLYAPEHYPGMLMSPSEQINFTLTSLAPKLKAYGLNTKIVIYDHNYDDAGINYVQTMLNNSDVRKVVAGVGFHTYASPNHAALTMVHDLYNKESWITEAGSGAWIGDATDQFQDQMMHMLRSARNWGKGVIFWNIALDQNASPKLVGVDVENNNRGFVTIRSDTMDAVSFETSYYSMGHSSKFVDPGAYRIDSTSWSDDVESVAYLNPDNTIALVISNRSNAKRDIKVTWRNYESELTMQPRSAATLKWSTF